MATTTQAERAAAFLQLHLGDQPLLIPNPWDQGSARLLASLGFRALATTSGGFAATLGRLDGHVSRGEALAHAALIASATELPVSADLENGFGDEPADVAATVDGAIGAGSAAVPSKTSRETPRLRSTSLPWQPSGSPRRSRWLIEGLCTWC